MNFTVAAFDIGGTLMEYKDMPYCWLDFYENAFRQMRDKLSLPLSDEDLKKSDEVLRSYNPRINYRETDYTPEHIFKDVTAHWDFEFSLPDVIKEFWLAFGLTPYTYPETETVLGRLKALGVKIATLTDVASAMPDEMHKSYFHNLMPYFDLYVSSLSCGYRKPNPKGLEDIAKHFNVSAQDIIFIGDEPKDVETAKRFGCKSVLIDRNNNGAYQGQDFTVRNLKEIEKFFERQN
ncbi:MAG: HAD-IA family hydrolase [Ruminococcus sp.]|nr:HAD-IA family hydrolase [Ruminococcus sp.]